jgi:membrane associated rhomboid family serine protease
MFPIHDNIPARTTPVANWLLIGVTSLVFLAQQREPETSIDIQSRSDLEDAQVAVEQAPPTIIEKYAMIPARITRPSEPIEIPIAVANVRTVDGGKKELPLTRIAKPPAVPPLLTLLTCVFLHGGWMHFLGNMWFLYIFGDNVEDRFGHVGYVIFYLCGGVIASLVHFITEPGSTVPTVGASGAIAAVMGAYFVWYPHALVKAIVPLFVVATIMEIPAIIFLGLWFVLQLFQGVTIDAAQGVAWWAHIGGFAAGYLIAGMLGRTPVTREKNPQVRPGEEHMRIYRVPMRGPRG